MARFLRQVDAQVAEQALINKTVNADQLLAVKDQDPPAIDEDELELLARDVPVPEMVPHEYAYVDLYRDDQDRYFVALNHTFYRRSKVKTLDPS